MTIRRGAEALEELRIRFRQVGADRYLVLANGPAAAADVIDWRPRVDFAEELDELFKEAFGQKARMNGATPVDTRLTELGRELFTTLIPAPIRNCLDESIGFAQDEDCKLRVRFDLPAALSDLPIEILRPPRDDRIGGTLALNSSLSVVRSVPYRNPRLPKPEDDAEPLAVLVVIASPRGSEPLNVAAELEQLEEALMPYKYGPVVLDVLGGPGTEDPATLTELTNRVMRPGSPLAVLLIAHGETSPDRSQACVVLESDDGCAQRVPADRLAGILGHSSRVRFVALNLSPRLHSGCGHHHALNVHLLLQRDLRAGRTGDNHLHHAEHSAPEARGARQAHPWKSSR